jgi:hypothetical protein
MSDIGTGVIFYGFVEAQSKDVWVREWGYFALSGLQEIRGSLGLCVERDVCFTPVRHSQVWRHV